ncbi:hypothetical protein PICMEDRAFT_17765 [Pichia membranifaciens NRRL Y-2026]|uniref:Exocyst complex component Sec10-like alpha-helical bundle domain-containing protein n=1 Tax=Pichia membranifaciens NRRL Y-2026 TaxID=763406 RepID=A0A1E3NIU9_9ASCO|nr:hypothetical protein PICMEDRAFT_17765 [Pichia membranifaciens NRRL Y-2026]ODQ45283.1 hypothetical protein PICMEDRAFT_17765 [Pichia membranifaciens NRRL Y-2026]
MTRTVVLPDYKGPESGTIPPVILDSVCSYVTNFNDLLNWSLMNKATYNHVMNNNDLWIRYLRKLKLWGKPATTPPAKAVSRSAAVSTPGEPIRSDDFKLNPLNCLDYQIDDPYMARATFIEIYSTLAPIVKQLLVESYSNFQNLSIFNTFSTPMSQAKLFTNIGNFLPIYESYENYGNLNIRFNTILNLFVNSIISELDVQLKDEKYPVVLDLITSLDHLCITSDRIPIDPLESLLEYFISKYNEDYLYLSADDLANQCFTSEPDLSTKRGVVKGFSFNFGKVSEIFDDIQKLLDSQLSEIRKIFSAGGKTHIAANRDIDEIPIILKILENFLSNHLIGGLSDRIISKAKQIDALDDITKPKPNLIDVRKSEELGQLDDNVHEDGSGANTKNQILEGNPNVNIMNEQSLFFQCVPYLHSKLISTLQNLNYPQTEIILDSSTKTKMDYVKVVCEFVNYYYEQYLIEFSNELPRQCHISLIQLISSWQTNNQKVQRNMEHEILKLVEEDEDDNKRFNFEIFNTFSNLFTFKSKPDDVETKEVSGESEKQTDNEVKLTKMAAKLKILVTKVESLKTLVSIDLTVLLLQHIKNSYDLLLGLTKYSTTEQLNKQIYKTCINIFSDMLTILISNHIKPGFLEALQRLKNYKPVNLNHGGADYENKTDGTLEPVNNFIELVDVGDLILQMISVFYNHELIQSGIIPVKNQHSRDFLRMNNIEKSIKLMESTLDTYVANGLDISIDIIISEIRFKVEECVGAIPLNSKSKSSTYSTMSSRPKSRPPQSSSSMMTSNTVTTTNTNNSINTNMTNASTIPGIESTVYNLISIETLPLNEGRTSEWCAICLEVLESHFSLLQDSIDKSIMDVFKQELGDRLITLLIQLLMMKFKISNVGGIQFSFDINTLYSYYQKNRIKPAIEYLIGFKKIDQLFLVDCSGRASSEFKPQCKELGKLIIDLGRENGVFTPEEVYQFVSRRSDWDRIKKNVDKVVYGFGADDCIIM